MILIIFIILMRSLILIGWCKNDLLGKGSCKNYYYFLKKIN
jgi:hypothetical protein